MPANRYISKLADCAELTSLQVLMGRDRAYKGCTAEKFLEILKI